MKKLLIYTWMLCLFAGCKRGNHQVVLLKNQSRESVCFIVTENDILKNPDEIARLRTQGSIGQIDTDFENEELAKRARYSMFRNGVERDSMAVVLTSESAGVFLNSITIEGIIDNRYK